ncbi:hypothetical protein [Actinomadura sp. WMMA1423]|uniref:hypothetical protein n=1 Tax=Actinomadura sp. WMMA1423 TaxID=2591108 RepID=UPI001F0D0C1B|nr:hypothetical protein [Actinomadura sp. WMMA1423]
MPVQATMAYAVEAFSRLLDEPGLTACDLGWPAGTVTGPDDPWRGDPVTWITTLGRSEMLDLDRRDALAAGLYSLAAAALPDRLHRITRRAGEPRRAGAADVARIRETTRYFGDLDDLYGGGHARSALGAYLTHDVAPLLRGTTGAARPALFVAAAELAYLAAYMAADSGRPGVAQRYYVQSVRLADEAEHPVMRATALRGLAVQAVELGHNRAGRDLADAAADGIRTGAPVRTRAWITGMCAEALAAASGDRARARSLLHAAEADLERADSLPEAEIAGAYRRESFAHQVGLTLHQLGDLAGAEEHYAASVDSRRPVERRTRALIGARLAYVQLRRRHPDQAARTLLDLSDTLTAVSSERVQGVLSQIRTAWQPYRGDADVRQADRLLTSVLRPA